LIFRLFRFLINRSKLKNLLYFNTKYRDTRMKSPLQSIGGLILK
jgi:hypothetical protein